MILIDQMKNFKIYKTPTFLPTLEKDKKKKSAIVLLTPDYNSSKSLMNHPLFVNKKRFESYYAERDVSYYIGNKKIEEVTDESTSLLETKRSNLKDSDFGIPEDRKFPLDTEQHVRSAIKLFGHAEESKKPALARKIASRARSYGIQIPETTQVYKYLHEDAKDNAHIKNVIFDIGGVLLDHANQKDALMEADIPFYFIDDYIKNYWHIKSDSADVASAKIAFIAMCDKDEEMKAYAPKAFYILSSCVQPLEYVDKMLTMLKLKGYNLYYLSNWSKFSFDLCKSQGKMDFLKYFDDGIVSYQVGYEKPDKSIYEIFKERLYIDDPNSCIFFDDKLDNIKAARACGINAVKWDQVDGPGWVLNNLIVDSLNEESINLFINEAVEDGHKYYLVSDNYLGDNKKVKPSIPKGSLDEKTERIRLYKSINGAMMAKGDKEVNTGRELFVHVPVDEDEIKVSTPSLSQVPNMNLTGEVWVKEEIAVKCIGKIRVGKPVKQYSYKLGDKDVTCHSWQYSWLTSQDKHVVDESAKSDNIITLDMNDPKAKKYLESNSYTKKYLDYLAENTGEILVDADKDKMIGYIFVGKKKDKGFISTLEVVKAYRGNGYGAKLLNDAIHKYGAIDLCVDKDNKLAYEMYKRHGFKVVDDTIKNGKQYYMKLG